VYWLLAIENSIAIGDYEIAETIAQWIELAAVAAISIAVVAAIVGAFRERTKSDWKTAFSTFKTYMGRGLLVGLDLLIAGDIIKTVTVEPTIENASVLALLVLIRTFLSWSIMLEIEGHWPWQAAPPKALEAD
jgi:uncharacterized membrane protein